MYRSTVPGISTNTIMMNKFPNPKKRRMPFSAPGSSTSEENVLSLDNPKPAQSVNVPEDEKVIKYLTKLETKRQSTSVYTAKIIIGLSEAGFFESQSDSFIASLKDDFGIIDFAISKHAPGSIDRIMSLTGEIDAVSKACIYISFIRCARLNKFISSEVFTFKSSNYRLTFLVTVAESHKIEQIGKTYHTTACSSSHPLTYNFNDGIYSTTVMGDFRSLFDFLDKLFFLDSKVRAVRVPTIGQSPIFGVHSDPHLYKRPDEKSTIDTSFNELLKFVYSKSVLEDVSD